VVAVASTDLFSFQPSHPSPAWGSRTHYEAKSYRGLFCGNDAINRFDVNGNSWLSSLWDRTIGSLGKKIAINWDHGRSDIELGAAIVASIFVGYEVAAYTELELAYMPYAGTWAPAVGDVVGGAAGGFVSGTSLAAVSGEHLGQALQSGLKGAEYGALQGGITGGTDLLNSDLGFSSAPTLSLGSPGKDLSYVGLRGLEGAVTAKLYDKDASVGFWGGIASGFSSFTIPKEWNWKEKDLEQGVIGGLSSVNKEGKGFMTGFWSAEAKAGVQFLDQYYDGHDHNPWERYPLRAFSNGLVQGAIGRFGGKMFSAGLFAGAEAQVLNDALGGFEDNPEKVNSATGPVNNGFKLLTPKTSHGRTTLPLDSITGGYWALGAPWDQL
jgi:hypothetical protein